MLSWRHDNLGVLCLPWEAWEAGKELRQKNLWEVVPDTPFNHDMIQETVPNSPPDPGSYNVENTWLTLINIRLKRLSVNFCKMGFQCSKIFCCSLFKDFPHLSSNFKLWKVPSHVENFPSSRTARLHLLLVKQISQVSHFSKVAREKLLE